MAQDSADAGLSPDRQAQLALFQEVTAETRTLDSAAQLLRSCNWNLEQAVQLHMASEEDGAQLAGSSSAAAGSGLGAPLLGGGDAATGQPAAAGGGSGGAGPTAGGGAERRSAFPIVGWFVREIRRLGVSIFGVITTFIFGPGGLQAGANSVSGPAFTRALTAAYGADLQLPQFFEGTFAQALQAARQQVKLLVVYLHSDNSRYAQSFCSEVLGNEFVRTMLDDSFLVWGGDVARMEPHRVAQFIRARQYPFLGVLLPASVDEARVIGARQGQVEVDAIVALLTQCLEEMESHRAQITAHREQQIEDRNLREDQDREYQEALEVDRKRQEEQRRQDEERREQERREAEQRQKEEEELQALEKRKEELAAKRQKHAAALDALGEAPEATSRLALRLPTGQRMQRKFLPTATLRDVYDWADCVGFMQENKEKDLVIPERFTLKTSFPSAELNEMERTVEELKLAGSNILLAEIEDDV